MRVRSEWRCLFSYWNRTQSIRYNQRFSFNLYRLKRSDEFNGLCGTNTVGVGYIWYYRKYCFPCHVRDWKTFFDPTAITTGTFPGFGVHVLFVQKSLKKPNGAHFEPQVQRPDNTALWWGFFLYRISSDGWVRSAVPPQSKPIDTLSPD